MIFLKICLPKNTLCGHMSLRGGEERLSSFFRLCLLRRILTCLDNLAVLAAGFLPPIVPQDPIVQSGQQTGGAGGLGEGICKNFELKSLQY